MAASLMYAGPSMANVLIDTQVFEALAYHFENSEFVALRELIDGGLVNVLISSIIDREVRAHLEAYALTAVQKLQTAIRQNASLRYVDGLNIGAMLKDDLHSTLAASRLAAWDKWKIENKVETLPNAIDIEAIIAAHFDATPPFGPKDKRNEWKDAITLSAAVQWCKAKGEKLVIVSGDGDTKAFCDGRSDLDHVDKLAPFLERFADEVLVSAIRETIEGMEADIIAHATDYIENVAYSSRDVDDFEVDGVYIRELYVQDISIAKAAEGVGIGEIELWADYDLVVKYERRERASLYEHYGGYELVKQKIRRREKITVGIEFTYDEADPTEVELTRYGYDEDERILKINPDDGDPCPY